MDKLFLCVQKGWDFETERLTPETGEYKHHLAKLQECLVIDCLEAPGTVLLYTMAANASVHILSALNSLHIFKILLIVKYFAWCKGSHICFARKMPVTNDGVCFETWLEL